MVKAYFILVSDGTLPVQQAIYHFHNATTCHGWAFDLSAIMTHSPQCHFSGIQADSG